MSREAEPGTGLFQRGMFPQDWRKIQGGGAHRGSVAQAPSCAARRLGQAVQGLTQPREGLCSFGRKLCLTNTCALHKVLSETKRGM